MMKRVKRLALFATLLGSLSFLMLGCVIPDKLIINNGDSATEISAHVGEMLPLLKRPSKKGYSFAGWSQDGAPVDVEKPLASSSPLNAEFVENTVASDGLRYVRFGKGLEVIGGESEEYETLAIPAYAAPFAGGDLFPVIKIGESAFRNTKIGNLILPDTLEEIGISAFEKAELPHPFLPYALSKIEDGAFRGASGFICFDCSERVASIAPTAFAGLKITSFRSFSKKFVAFDNALFEGNTLFAYPAGTAPRNYETPDFVDTVGEYAFYGQTFGSLSLGNVARIAAHALENAAAAELKLPSVKALGEEAMRGFQTETLTFPASATAFGARSIEALHARRIVFRALPTFQNSGNPEALIYAPAGTIKTFSAVFPERTIADAAALEGKNAIVVDGVLVDCPDGVTSLSVAPEVKEIAPSALNVPNLETIEFAGAPPKFGANAFYGSSALRILVPARYFADYRAACPAYADRVSATEDVTEPEPENVTLTLSADGNDTKIVLARGERYRLPVLEKTGFRFAGWICGDQTFAAGAEITAEEDLAFSAAFEVLTYRVLFYSENTLLKTEQVPYGGAATAPELPFKPATEASEFSFDGWDAPFDSVTTELEIHAVYRAFPRKYEVTFLADSVVLKRELVEYLGSATAPDDPVKESTPACRYEFSGWDKDYGRITENTTISATFHETTRIYTVRFFSGDAAIQTERVAYGGSATAPPEPEKPSDPAFDYRFDGWSCDFSKITGDLDVKAKFTELPRSYTVRFFSDETLLKTETVAYGGAATAPELVPEKPSTAELDYKWIGWNGTFDRIEQNTDISAVFEETARVYAVKFYAEDKLLSSVSVPYGASAAAPEVPGKDSTAEFDYIFVGWDGEFDRVAGDLEIHAVYGSERRSYRVSFWVDAVAVAESIVPYGQAANAPAPPRKDSDAEFDYEFVDWDKAFDRVIGALEVNAVFRSIKRSYTVTFSVEDTIVETRTILYGDPIGTLPEKFQDRQIVRFEDLAGIVYTGAEIVSGALTLYAVFSAPPRDPYAGSEGLEISYDADLNGYSVEYYTGDDTDVIVPSRYCGAEGGSPGRKARQKRIF